MFQTGTGDTTGMDRVPAVYALDVSNPASPTVLWEYSLADTAARGTFELGVGVTLAAGRVADRHQPQVHRVRADQQRRHARRQRRRRHRDQHRETGAEGVADRLSVHDGAARGRRQHPVRRPASPVVRSAIDKTRPGLRHRRRLRRRCTAICGRSIRSPASAVATGTPAQRRCSGSSTDYHPIGTKPAIYSSSGIPVRGGRRRAGTPTSSERHHLDRPPATTHYACVRSRRPASDAADPAEAQRDHGRDPTSGSSSRSAPARVATRRPPSSATRCSSRPTPPTSTQQRHRPYGTPARAATSTATTSAASTQATTVVVEGGQLGRSPRGNDGLHVGAARRISR